MIVVIPSYQPDEKMVNTVRELAERTDYPIVVVDDGSDADKQRFFDEVAPLATVLHHEVNRGKGAAMKTAFAYIAEHYPEDEGVVTADADGQHLLKDIIRASEAWEKNPGALVLGSRRFTGKVPFKSRAGNAITRKVFRLSTGVAVYDTQTGLRAFGVKRIPEMLEMKGDRYEYEINQLLYATRRHIPIEEVTIDTVYIEDNASSHFHALRDSWRIYKMILLFVASSAAAALIDYVLVLALTPVFSGTSLAKPLLAATALSRVISSLCNYFINRKVVFEQKGNRSILRYYVLAVAIYLANYGILSLLNAVLPLWLAKLLVELVLYPVSFYCQRRFVFTEEK